MKKRKGAVSLFLIIVMFSCVFLSGLFIDASRVLLAKRAVRNAANSAARSALSYYDTNLAKEYGMFAVDAQTAQDAFKRYFKTNLELSQNDGFNILKMQPKEDGIKVETGKPLLNTEVMQAEMEDYSKYRVVVNTSVGVVEKIKGLFEKRSTKVFNAAGTGKTAMDGLKKAAKEFSNRARGLISSGIQTQVDRVKDNVMKELENAVTAPTDMGFDKIEEQIRQAKTESDEIAKKADGYRQETEKQSQELDEMSSLGTEYWDEETQSWKTQVNKPEETQDEFTEIADTVERETMDEKALEEKAALDRLIAETEDRYKEQKKQIEMKTQQVVSLNKEINQLNVEIGKLTEKIDRLGADINVLKKDISKLEEQLNVPKREVKKISGNLEKLRKEADRLEQASDPYDYDMTDVREDLAKEFERLKHNYDSAKDGPLGMVISVLQKKELEDHIQAIRDEGYDLVLRIDVLKKKIAAAEKQQQKIEQEQMAPIEAQINYKTDLKDQYTAERNQKISEKAEKEKEREGIKNKRDGLIAEISNHYDEIAADESTAAELELPELSEEEKEAVRKEKDNSLFMEKVMELLGIDTLFTEFGKMADIDEGSASWTEAFKFDAIAGSVWSTVDQIKEMAGGIGALISGTSDAEAAMLFTDYVFSNCAFLTSQTPRNNRHFQMAEIEYILTGQDPQLQSFVTVVNDIIMLRLLINWVDYMVTTQSPEIISRIMIALGRALIKSVDDLGQMIFIIGDVKGSASCGLCPSFDKVRLTYSDHLRLNMMLRALNETSRNRMMQRFQTLMNSTFKANRDDGWSTTDTLVTEISATVTVEVDLVMLTLPMFEKVLPADNPILQNGKFIVQESVKLGY